MPVHSKHPQYNDHIEDWEDCRLFYLGEKAVKQTGRRFLPKPEDVTTKEYINYVHRAFFFAGVERTVAGLSGAIDRKDPSFKIPKRIEYIQRDADSNGASLRQFSKSVLDEVFITGRCGILCERDEEGNPPYLVCYPAESIINWAVDTYQNLTLVVLQEWYYETAPDDPFVQVKRKRYRVLMLEEGRYIQRIYTEFPNNNSKTSFNLQQLGGDIEIERAGMPVKEIPFVFVNARSITTRIDKPPLLDLVYKNAEHYRVSADYANALYFTGNPILVAKGVKKPKVPRCPTRNADLPQNLAGDPVDFNEPDFKISLGSSRAVFIPKEADILLVECRGHGVAPNRDRANDIKMEMAVLGARLLESQRSGVEAAETATIRQSGETSTLMDLVVNVSSAIRKALGLLNTWEGGPEDDKTIEFSLNTDFIEVIMNPQLLSALADLVNKELISWDTFYYNLAAGELTVPGRTAEEEREEIEKQPPMAVPAMGVPLSGLNPPQG